MHVCGVGMCSQDLYQRASEATVLRSLLELTKANELDMAEREAEDTLRHMDMLVRYMRMLKPPQIAQRCILVAIVCLRLLVSLLPPVL